MKAKEMAQEVADYVDRVTESCRNLGNSATISLIPPDSQFVVANYNCYTSLERDYYRPRRLKCAYCDCISSKESGTCEHCGAPLVEEEY